MYKREDYGIVLDFLPHGKAGEAKKEPVAQLLGESYFTLLEVVIKPGVKVGAGSKVYIGPDQRDEVDYIRGRVTFQQLTASAAKQCEVEVRKIVNIKEGEFVSFLNKAGPINIRSHSLEHLPSVGKKHLESLLAARDRKPFESFEDVQNRVPHIGNVEEIFANRLMQEIKGGEKYYLFTKPPASDETPIRQFDRRRY